MIRKIGAITFLMTLLLAQPFTLPLKAQTALQFSAVKWVNSDTVPAGKVWKVTRIVNLVGSSQRIAMVDGQSIGSFEGYNSGLSATPNNAVNTSFTGPFWLPEGTVVSSTSGSLRWSVIEFTVVP